MNFYKIIFAIIAVSIITGLIWRSGFFNIDQIDVEKNNVQCIDNQKFLSEFKIKSENIFLVDKQKLEENILSKYACVKNIILEKIFPNKIKIIINGRYNMAKISNIKNDILINLEELEATSSSVAALIDWTVPASNEIERFIADDEGIIFSNSSENNLPIIYMPDQILRIGEKIRVEDFSKIALFFIKLSQMNINFTQTKLIEHNLQVLSEPKIVFSLEKDIFKQLASLQLILGKAKIDNNTMEMIDLRFNKPIIKYLPKK